MPVPPGGFFTLGRATPRERVLNGETGGAAFSKVSACFPRQHFSLPRCLFLLLVYTDPPRTTGRVSLRLDARSPLRYLLSAFQVKTRRLNNASGVWPATAQR